MLQCKEGARICCGWAHEVQSYPTRILYVQPFSFNFREQNKACPTVHAQNRQWLATIG